MRWLWPVLLAATIFIASGRSNVSAPHIIGFDKVAHFFVFGLLGNLLQRSLPASKHRATIAIAIISLLGLADEWHQSFTPGRSVEFGDWLCDTAGAVLAVCLYEGTRWYAVILETCLTATRAKRPVKAKAPSEVPVQLAANAIPPSGD